MRVLLSMFAPPPLTCVCVLGVCCCYVSACGIVVIMIVGILGGGGGGDEHAGLCVRCGLQDTTHTSANRKLPHTSLAPHARKWYAFQ